MPDSGRNIEIIRKDAGIVDEDGFKILVNQIGNKIFLEKHINKSINNDWFRTKKQTSIHKKTGYKNSSFVLAQDLTNYRKDRWTKEDIKKQLIKQRRGL